MALADFYKRNAVAASQVLAGFDEVRFKATLDQIRVGIVLGRDAGESAEARNIAHLLVRLLARVYPNLGVRSVNCDNFCDEVIALARKVNPNIELASEATIEVIIGDPAETSKAPVRIYLGSNGWSALASTGGPRPVGASKNPFGASVAACLGAANVFRSVFQGNQALLDTNTTLTIPGLELNELSVDLSGELGEIVLVGCGAIGNAAAWALSRLPMDGLVHLVDHEYIDLGNLQRYVLADREDEGRLKVETLSSYFTGPIKAQPHPSTFEGFVEQCGYAWPKMLLALDSARVRRYAQASLPRWVSNAWTQIGDLGVSNHDFLNGACVNCLYLPAAALDNEDQLMANSFGVPDKLQQVRTLLHSAGGVPQDLLESISTAKGIPWDRLSPFLGRPIRALYVEGFCGGAVIPLGSTGMPRQDVHVPLAHQSAMAGVLLAAEAVNHSIRQKEELGTTVTRIDLMRPIGSYLVQSAQKDARGICICQDADYRAVYQNKYHHDPGMLNSAEIGPEQ